MSQVHVWAATTLCSFVLLMPSFALAQSSLQVPLQFDFLNPGARSLSLGSAFTGLADDATAAFTNPAGLLLLGRAEVSLEGRYRQVSTPFLDRGRLTGALTNRGDDTVLGAQYQRIRPTLSGHRIFLSSIRSRRGRSPPIGTNWSRCGTPFSRAGFSSKSVRGRTANYRSTRSETSIL